MNNKLPPYFIRCSIENYLIFFIISIVFLAMMQNAFAKELIPLEMYWSLQRGDNITCGTVACRQAVINTGGYRYLRVEGCALRAREAGTIPLMLYWHPKRKDNVTVASAKSRAEQVNTGGYRLVRIEGYIYKHKRKGTIPLKLYWYPKRTDNATVAAAKSIAAQNNTKGMSYIRTEGYIYPASKCRKSQPAPSNTFNFKLKGDTSCAWGSKHCNRCVNNVKANFNAIETKIRGKHAGKIRVRSYAYPTKGYMLHRINKGTFGVYEHIQGIGRIAGLGNNEYFVFTHSTDSNKSRKSGALAVIRMGANQKSGGYKLGDLRNKAGKNQNIHNRTVARTYSNSNHPGGLATLGHYVFVADWCQDHGKYKWCNNPSQYAFEVYDVSKSHLNTHRLNSNPPIKIIDRSVFYDHWLNKRSTASIAATRLKNGRYLVAIGKSGGRHYGFYLSSTSRLSHHTRWKFIDDDPIEKWGEGAAMVNECGTGDIYQIQIEKWRNRKNKLHLFKLNSDSNKKKISYRYINSRTFSCVDNNLVWCDFDKGGGIYISPQGNLYLYATDAQQAKSTERFRMVEFGNYRER